MRGTTIINASVVLWTLVMTCLGASSAEAQQQVLFLDDFKVLDRRIWNMEVGDGSSSGKPGWGNNELQCYTESADNVDVIANPDKNEDGILRIRSIYSKTPQPCTSPDSPATSKQWTSARLNTRGKRVFNPLRDGQVCSPMTVEARIKFPGKAGHKGALWVLGVSGSWPKSGQIDVVEHVGKNAPILGTAYFANTEGKPEHLPIENRIQLPSADNTWNTYRVDLDCDVIRWVVNDEPKLQVKKSQVNVWAFDQPFYLLINMAVGGNLAGQEADTSGGDMLVDYVKVYSMASPIPSASSDMVTTSAAGSRGLSVVLALLAVLVGGWLMQLF